MSCYVIQLPNSLNHPGPGKLKGTIVLRSYDFRIQVFTSTGITSNQYNVYRVSDWIIAYTISDSSGFVYFVFVSV